MKIVFISLYNTAPWGGCEDLWVKTAAYSARQGHDVLASVFDFGPETSSKILDLRKLGVQLNFRKKINDYKSVYGRLKLKIKNNVKILDKTYYGLFKFKPDVIFINDPGTFMYVRDYHVLQNEIKKHKIPYIIICKLTPDYGSAITNELRQRAIEVFGNARKMLFVSERMRHNVERYLAMKLSNTPVVQNPVNLESFDIVDYPESEKTHFAMVAHLGIAHKGQHIVFDILSGEYWKDKNWQLNLYGRGSDQEYLQELCKYYDLSDKVVYYDHVKNIHDIWQNNHVLLFPSTSEGMPKALIEAMVCGRTVVASDVGGITEVVTDNVNGFIAEAPSVNSFGNALKKAWENKEKWHDMGMVAHNSIMKWIDKNPEDTLLKIIADER